MLLIKKSHSLKWLPGSLPPYFSGFDFSRNGRKKTDSTILRTRGPEQAELLSRERRKEQSLRLQVRSRESLMEA